jgi:hypothetical protein
MRTVLLVVGVAAVLVVLGLARAAYDDGPTPAERRCEQAQVAANTVTDREDTVDDEVEYLHLAKVAERACAAALR